MALYLDPYEGDTPTKLYILKYILNEKVCDDQLIKCNEQFMQHVHGMNLHQPECNFDQFRYDYSWLFIDYTTNIQN